MIFSSPLIAGHLIKRYNRFLADIETVDGEKITAHCPNSGAMLGIKEPGTPVWVSKSNNPNRKLAYTWEMVFLEGTYIGVNTHHPNDLVQEALQKNHIKELTGYERWRREVKYGTQCRIDFLLENPGACYVEIKNVHLKRGKGAYFPDCITERGAKHMRELQKLIPHARAVVLYVIQRQDCDFFSLADDLDPVYAAAAREAKARGVEVYAYDCQINPKEITLHKSVPVVYSP